MFQIFPNARIKPSPYFAATLSEGMVSASIYNSMILPTSYGDPEAEYWRLIEGVSQWDVAVERQVQIAGPDASVLAQMLCVRDLSKCKWGQGKYAPICNHDGVLINDPIALKFNDHLWWLSIADSDIWLWARAIAAERGLDVQICDPGVSPMAVQGPKAVEVIADVFGDWVRDLKYFWFSETEIEGIPVAVQRSGWSKQGGFEIYLMDETRGVDLWNIVREAGEPYDIGPGTPMTPERTESGLVSVGGDTDARTNPFEVRLGPFVNLDVPDDTIGIQALRQIHEQGPERHQLGIKLPGVLHEPLGFEWEAILKDGQKVGDMTNAAWSFRMRQNIGYALVSSDVQAGETVVVQRQSGPVEAELVELPFF